MKIKVQVTTKHCESDDLCVETFIVEHDSIDEVEALTHEMVNDCEDDEKIFDYEVTEYKEPVVIDIDKLRAEFYCNWEWEPEE